LSRDAIREMLGICEELRNDDSIAVALTTGFSGCWNRHAAAGRTCPGQSPRLCRNKGIPQI